jgi:hypothetical protein
MFLLEGAIYSNESETTFRKITKTYLAGQSGTMLYVRYLESKILNDFSNTEEQEQRGKRFRWRCLQVNVDV